MDGIIRKIAYRTTNPANLTVDEKIMVVSKYSQIGSDKDDWIRWVLESLKRNKCPYR